MKKLNRENVSNLQKRPLKVMQFGGGNFLRAFVDWKIEILNKLTDFNGNIAIIKPTERGDYHALKEQGGLFHVVLNGIKKGKLENEVTLISCVSEVINPYKEWNAYLALAELKEMRYIISNTTEAGIKVDNTEVHPVHTPAREFPGKLTQWLFHRYEYFGGSSESSCVMLPCELIESNGEELRKCILEYASIWNLEKGFSEWILNECLFCNTLVDRIVTGYPTAGASAIHAQLGYEDNLLVAGEIYHSWIIQGPESVSRELPFVQTGLNVKFTTDLDIHRKIKVRILNGAHSALVSVGYLHGVRTVREAMENPEISKYLEDLLFEEIIPSIGYNLEALKEFAFDVIDRFKNPSIVHKLESIALNSTSKYKTRLLPSLLDYVNKFDAIPEKIVLALAAMLRFYKGQWQGQITPIKDDPEMVRFIQGLWVEFDGGKIGYNKLAESFLGNEEWWNQDLNQVSGLSVHLAKALEKIHSKNKVL